MSFPRKTLTSEAQVKQGGTGLHQLPAVSPRQSLEEATVMGLMKQGTTGFSASSREMRKLFPAVDAS